MDLVFATVESCEAAGCHVRFLGAPETTVWTRYSPAVQDQIRIRRGQLVAVDRATEPPQTVWRWMRAEVLELRPTGAVVGAYGICSELPLRDPDLRLQKGDQVWVGSNGTEKLIQDLVCDDGPKHPDTLAALAFPNIKAWYAGSAG
jgi:hypothetical protein